MNNFPLHKLSFPVNCRYRHNRFLAALPYYPQLKSREPNLEFFFAANAIPFSCLWGYIINLLC